MSLLNSFTFLLYDLLTLVEITLGFFTVLKGVNYGNKARCRLNKQSLDKGAINQIDSGSLTFVNFATYEMCIQRRDFLLPWRDLNPSSPSNAERLRLMYSVLKVSKTLNNDFNGPYAYSPFITIETFQSVVGMTRPKVA